MAKVLSEEDIAVYKELFDSYDKERTGMITLTQLRTLLDSIGQHGNRSDGKELLKKVKIKDEGKVDFNMFLDCLSVETTESHEEQEREMKEAFRVLDKDGKGFIKVDCLRSAFGSLEEQMSEAEVEEIIREIDLNQDGTINYEDVARAMLKND